MSIRINRQFRLVFRYIDNDAFDVHIGEAWRILTAAFVHFSPAHLFYNLTGFLLCGLILEIGKYPYVLSLYGISIALMGDTNWREAMCGTFSFYNIKGD
ncbi:MAG: hypothetical protein DRG24_09575 [Epsilonproteobacteria bacterium]|nr:MAG: hypothetical protein DRG24_09575 [Campylobacterota bacterium]